MDAFYASVEQRDNPALRGKPIAVGHAEERGVVAAASYEARRFGVRSAMSSLKAKRLCPQLIFIPGRMEVYKSVSRQIHEIFHEYTDVIEPISLDEAFLDVTENKPGIPLAVDIAKEIKRKMRERLNLVASAGISYNKFLAKIASDYRKPDGLCTIHPAQALDFVARLPIESFWGVGPVTAKKMHTLGIHNGEQLRMQSLEMLTREFGKVGTVYYDFARGIDIRPVEAVRIRKSVGCEHTLEKDISKRSSVIIELYHAAVKKRKAMGCFMNILWLMFGGIITAVEYLIASLLMMFTIIGIPFGMQTLKMASLALWPFGKEVRSGERSNGCLYVLMNILWIFLGGIWICLSHLGFGLLLCITIIGIPFGIQHFKLAGLALTPFGKDIVAA